MSDFGRMREFAGDQADYIAELEAIIAELPPTQKSKFPARPESLADNPLAPPSLPPAPPEPAPEPPPEPAPEPAP